MCHVLIIEDEALTAADIAGIVRRVGATTIAFADTVQLAVEQAAMDKPAVIISDVMLSSGSGPDAVREIIAIQGDTPVIFITALPDEVETFTNVSVIDKPFFPEELAAAFVAVAPV